MNVGTCGAKGERCGEEMAKAFSLPALSIALEEAKPSSISAVCPLTTSVSEATAPL